MTQAGEAEQDQGWAAVVFDLVARRYRERLRRLPKPDHARAELSAALLRSAGELSAADAAAALGLTRGAAQAALERLVDEGRARRYAGEGFELWAPVRADRRRR